VSERLTDSGFDSLPANAGFFGSEGHAGSDSDHRLVKRTKSPTLLNVPKTLPDTPGAYSVIQFREWCDEYRIRTRIETTTGSLPPEQSGARTTDSLTFRAARKIGESCQYVALKQGGYKTFATLTFDATHRAAIARGDTTIQREVTRYTDALSKMWARGWSEQFDIAGRRYHTADKNGEPVRHAGRDKPFLYLWVVECPDTIDKKTGEILGENPHVHILLNWRVKFGAFPAWAKRIEQLWGQGFAHLEKIKDSDAAGSYMMKAAGYLSKAQGKGDQGTVRGNRYGMSSEARAPNWVTLEEKQLHIMGALIADVAQHVQEKYGEQLRQRVELKQRLDNCPAHHKKRRTDLGRKLSEVRKSLSKNLPIVAGQYQILIKGGDAFHEFMHWARSPGHWRADIDWLPEKGPGENWKPGERPDSQWFALFKKNHYWRRACRAAFNIGLFGFGGGFDDAAREYANYPEYSAI
jgi:hypothetical protein